MEELVVSPETLGRVIKRQRKNIGLTQHEAGKIFKLNQTTVSNIENGTPGTRLETLFRLLAALDLEIVIRAKSKDELENKDSW